MMAKERALILWLPTHPGAPSLVSYISFQSFDSLRSCTCMCVQVLLTKHDAFPGNVSSDVCSHNESTISIISYGNISNVGFIRSLSSLSPWVLLEISSANQQKRETKGKTSRFDLTTRSLRKWLPQTSEAQINKEVSCLDK